jgi:hypothetical protein
MTSEGHEAVSQIEEPRKVWVATVPEGDEWGIGPCEVMVEQFGDRPPTVAFRREQSFSGNAGVWGRPYRGEVR